MDRAAVAWIAAVLLLAGCKGQPSMPDPFMTRVPPPGTGTATGAAPIVPFSVPPGTMPPTVTPPVISPGTPGGYTAPPTTIYPQSSSTGSVYRPQANTAAAPASPAVGARPSSFAPNNSPATGGTVPPTSGLVTPQGAPGWTGAGANPATDPRLTNAPPPPTQVAQRTTGSLTSASAPTVPAIPAQATAATPPPTEITDLPQIRPLDGRRPTGFRPAGT